MGAVDSQERFRLGKRPTISRMKAHNVKSWSRVEDALSNAQGEATFKSLSLAVTDHESGDKRKPYPYQFIVYCIKNGWLKRV